MSLRDAVWEETEFKGRRLGGEKVSWTLLRGSRSLRDVWKLEGLSLGGEGVRDTLFKRRGSSRDAILQERKFEGLCLGGEREFKGCCLGAGV